MASTQCLVVLFLITFTSTAFSRSILETSPKSHHSFTFNPISIRRKIPNDCDNWYCDSWRLSVETDNARSWTQIPARCLDFVEEYATCHHYSSDLEVVAKNALEFAKEVNVSIHGKDAWVFDIDETLLSNVGYFQLNGFGHVDVAALFSEWVDLAVDPALSASLVLYKELQKMGFKLILLTGRNESLRNATKKNLFEAGYSNWERLIMRRPPDMNKTVTEFKSEKRRELIYHGFTLHGNCGDQWSDLRGFAVATRSFKLPNPMYYIPL
ncbi:unnamed protein product [Ilex paraguariensis]|uniref:Acid phosphatase n=1 Tax=Ilex paraguariensis TaxID=185542 RepID=A0ABC8S6K9_9AQUA